MDVVELTQRLVRIPSVNPDSTTPDTPGTGEADMAGAIAGVLRDLGGAVTVAEVLPGRPNVTGYFDFGADRTLVFDAHIDTVPVEGMVVDPFGGNIDNGRIYGRGASDVKGPGAAVMAALGRVRDYCATGEKARYNVLYAAVCDEESGFKGVKHFVRHMLPGELTTPIAGVVVVEPTGLHAIVAHKGVVRWNITTGGVASHSSAPASGVNAIYRMAKVIAVLESYASELQSQPAHAYLGTATLSVGVIHGGSAVNIVPDACTIQVDRRLVPGETPREATADLHSALLRLGIDTKSFEISDPIVEAPPMATDPASELVGQILTAGRGEGLSPEIQYASYCTDGSFYGDLNLPVVVVGPGSIAQAHTKDEWITIEDLRKGADVFFRIISGTE